MKIEILYRNLTNVLGDMGNIRYLEESFPDAKFIYTDVHKEPYFNKHDVDLIYLGSMPDEYFLVILNALKKYKKRLLELINKDVVVLFTGTAFDLCGDYIIEDNKKTKTLGLFKDIYFVKDKDRRHNSLFLGSFDDIKIVGNKSQFTFMYGNNKHPFIKANPGCCGMNKDCLDEGIHYHNFFGTSVLGPLLILNPYFTKYLYNLLNVKTKLPMEELLIEAYKERLKELERPNKLYSLGDHGNSKN